MGAAQPISGLIGASVNTNPGGLEAHVFTSKTETYAILSLKWHEKRHPYVFAVTVLSLFLSLFLENISKALLKHSWTGLGFGGPMYFQGIEGVNL